MFQKLAKQTIQFLKIINFYLAFHNQISIFGDIIWAGDT